MPSTPTTWMMMNANTTQHATTKASTSTRAQAYATSTRQKRHTRVHDAVRSTIQQSDWWVGAEAVFVLALAQYTYQLNEHTLPNKRRM
jgi:hypothetical protein